VFDLATTISKFLYLGLGLEDALARAAVYPAQILGISDRIGTLKQGAEGDAVVLKIETGAFDLWDAHEQRRTGEKRMVVTKVVAKGKVYR
jgi:dihydroorotase